MERNEQLREAFAQLLAMNQREAIPAEALWAAQGRQQLPPPPSDPEIAHMRAFKGTEAEGNWLPQRQPVPDPDPTTRAAEFMPKATEPPFGGKGVVVGPYKLPEKTKNKKKGKD